MTPAPPTTRHAADADDADLRQALQRATPINDPGTLAALQDRVMAQWELRSAAHVAVPVGGPVAALLHGVRTHRWQWLAAAMVIALALGLQARHMALESSVDDLLEPDVLSLMALGEL